MSFTPDLLKQILSNYNEAPVLWVAYSGGCDSHVLLHAIAALRADLKPEIKAIHINHGLSSLAGEWELHCQAICEGLSIPYQAISVNVNADKASPEEAARDARYTALATVIKQNEILLLAHHKDDQAETVLLQLLRGSGVKGLSAMPEERAFYGGKLCRPLLNFTREELKSYALEAGLNWIDDPSNFDTDYDRNFLRHEVIPLIQTRWPGLKKTLSRTAAHQAEADKLLTGIAEQDWQALHEGNQLRIDPLQKLEKGRQRNVLRYWLASVCKLGLPDTVHLQRIIDEVLPAAEDAMPEVTWQGGEVRRYQGLLYAQESLLKPAGYFSQVWLDINQPLLLPGTGRCLSAKSVAGEGLSKKKLEKAEISIRFRRGGESCRPVGRGHTHQLKKLFQEWQIPPWLRASIPLVFAGEELVQVVGYCLSEAFAAVENEEGLVISLD